MEAYIRGAAVISPQKTFGQEGFPEEFVHQSNIRALKCMEPNYRDFIDPMVSRRMSRIVKMGVAGALKCMQVSGIPMPDAVITGTGLGCLEDTGKFIASIFENEEKLLNPTPFIQSTHNTVAGAIALAIKCHGYNSTYTHRGNSFESALLDAMVQLTEDPGMNILAGGFDELTETSLKITSRLGLWKNHDVDTASLAEYGTRGSIPGEGTAFFMLSGKPGENDMAKLKGLQIFYSYDRKGIKQDALNEFLEMSGNTPDVMLLGINGDPVTDELYHRAADVLPKDTARLMFKDLCGEYDTSSSFALWLACVILKEQHIPSVLLKGSKHPQQINNVLIYNHLRGINHSLYLLEKC